MFTGIRTGFARRAIVVTVALLGAALLSVCGGCAAKLAEPITQGQRVFTCGHSFHVWVPDIVADLCRKAGIQGHTQIGISSIGGSKIIQHWDIPDDQNTAKKALKTGNVDVLTLSPIFLPDPGIENFTKLALEHNKDIRILVQPIWLRWDIYEPTTQIPAKVDHNAITGPELWKLHEVYFRDMDAHIRKLNKEQGKTVLYIVPAAQAVIALREKIMAGQAPGLKSQEDLFVDTLGPGRLLQFRRDVSPLPDRPARARGSEKRQARRERGKTQQAPAGTGLERRPQPPAQRRAVECTTVRNS
jgi:hypothetical protein